MMTKLTTLSDLRKLPCPSEEEGMSRLVRSIQQSMQLEGYSVSENDVRASIARVLGR